MLSISTPQKEYHTRESRMLRLLVNHPTSALAFVQQPGFPLLLAALEAMLPQRPNTVRTVLSSLMAQPDAWSFVGEAERERAGRCLALLADTCINPVPPATTTSEPYNYEVLTSPTPALWSPAAMTLVCTQALSSFSHALKMGSSISWSYLFYLVRKP